jgi:hypothetical protein
VINLPGIDHHEDFVDCGYLSLQTTKGQENWLPEAAILIWNKKGIILALFCNPYSSASVPSPTVFGVKTFEARQFRIFVIPNN